MIATSRRGVWVAIVVVVAVAVPLFVLALRAALGHWLSYSDWAAIEIRTRDVGTVHTPLVGPYSRYGWSHPGPLMFYSLALPYRVLGAQGKGVLVGAVAINTGALACIGAVLWRRGRALALVTGAAIVLLLLRALHAELLANPWNPYIIVVPMLAVVLLCWETVDGGARWALPTAVGLGSFAVQSHVGATLGVAVPIAVAIVYIVLDARTAGEWVALRTTAIVAAGVGIACWLPPIVQQFSPDGGNLGDLLRFWTTSHSDITGWSEGARIAGAQLALPAPWVTGHEAHSAFTGGVISSWHVPIALILLVAALVFAVRRRDRQSSRLCVLAIAVVLAAGISASRIVDVPANYIVRWIWIVGPVVWFAIIWTAVRALPEKRAVTIVAGAAVVVLGVVLTVGAVNTAFQNSGNDETSVAAFAPDARAALRALPSPVLVDNAGDLRSLTIAMGIATLGIHAGVDARLPHSADNAVGSSHTIRPGQARSTIVVAADDAGARYRTDPRYRLLASYDPLTPAERAEQRALHDAVQQVLPRGAAAVRQWSAAHPGSEARLGDLDGRGPRIDLFLLQEE